MFFPPIARMNFRCWQLIESIYIYLNYSSKFEYIFIWFQGQCNILSITDKIYLEHMWNNWWSGKSFLIIKTISHKANTMRLKCIVAVIVIYVVSFHLVLFILLLEQLLEPRGGSKLIWEPRFTSIYYTVTVTDPLFLIQHLELMLNVRLLMILISL